jgi:uncharacterized membrane protein YozB (DUF420 family)
LLLSTATMTIFDLLLISATLNRPEYAADLRWDGAFVRRRKMGKFPLPIWLYGSVTGKIVYFMLYQRFPSTHFEEVKKRYELRMESAKH